MTRLAEAYKRGYEIRYKDMQDASELKMHYFKMKEDLPRVQVVLSFLQGIVPAGQCQPLLDRNRSREEVVPQPIVEKMPGKMVLSEAYEAERVEWFSV